MKQKKTSDISLTGQQLGLWGGTELGPKPARKRVRDSQPPTKAALLRHARALEGVSMAQIADGLGLPVPSGAVRTKGWAGQILERELGAGDGENRGQDFASLGVELKTVPVRPNGRPLESTAVCQIDPVMIAGESWETSYARKKLSTVMFVALTVPSKGANVGDRTVSAVRLWTPSPAEDEILGQDFNLFVRAYFRKGLGHTITGHLGQALQVRPKGQNNRDTQRAYGPDGRPLEIRKCGFYLRPAFVARIFRGEPNAHDNKHA